MKEIIIFTDGACLGNPGPGGWAAIIRHPDHEQTLQGGFRHTTNNRMEILAVVASLQALPAPSHVTLVSDSQYVCNAVAKNWIGGWQKNGWRTASKTPVKNRDLWEQLLPELNRHAVRFQWIRGHNGHTENERCDCLARECASRASSLPEDPGFSGE